MLRLRKAGLPNGGVTVWLRAGTYELSRTLEFGPEDSGRADAPVVYRAAPGEDVWISGGVIAPPTAFSRTTDPAVLRILREKARGRVVQVSLRKLGITDWLPQLPDSHSGYKPPRPLDRCRVMIARLKGPLVRCTGAEFITFRGLGFEGGRADGLFIRDGRNVRVVACEIRNVNGNGVTIRNGVEHQVLGCDIHHTGAGGIDMRGGDRQTLSPANYLACNNHIHHTSELKRNYAAPLTLYGVGIRAEHNLIHHIPHIAVLYGGNDLTVEYNEIYWCLYETSEAGVFYTGWNWTYRGNVVQYNYIHHWNALTGEKVKLPSRARLLVDDQALYVAFDNPVEGLVGGRKWGRSDAVEVAISVVRRNEPGPILIWRGYTDGHFETSDEAGAPKALIERALKGVRYGAKVLSEKRWTAEFRIPFTAIGVDPRKHNPRMLFALSVRKARSDLWVTWKKSRGYTWDVRHSGVLWFEPFGNVSLGGLIPSRAYVLLYGLGSPATLLEPGRNCEPAGWHKPPGSAVSFHTGDLSGESWKQAAFSFTPRTDGKVLLMLMGRAEIDPGTQRFIPVWTCYDDIRVEGAALVNGGFERLDPDGSPQGWKAALGRPLVVTDPDLAAEGRRCVKCWHNGRWAQTLTVKAGRRVTVHLRMRGEPTIAK